MASSGQFIVIVCPPKSLFENNQNMYWQTVQAWVQVTQIGLDAFTDHSEMVAWATALKDGAPLSGCDHRSRIRAGSRLPPAQMALPALPSRTAPPTWLPARAPTRPCCRARPTTGAMTAWTAAAVSR